MNKKMSRLLCLMMVIVMSLALLSGCQSDKAKDVSEEVTTVAEVKVTEDIASADEVPEEPEEEATEEPEEETTADEAVEETAEEAPSDDVVEEPGEEVGTDEDGWFKGYTKGYIPVDGGQVVYRIYGEDKPGTPVIFLHGGPGSSSHYFFKQYAIGANRPVVLYNQLGSAGSDVSDEYTTADQVKELFTIEHFVNELETVVNYFNFDEFVILGHSWGSMLAVEYTAAKQPDKLKGLVLVGPFLKVDVWIEDAGRLIKTLPDGEEMWKTIQECESSGVYGEEYDKINAIYSANFYSRVEGAGDGTPTDPEIKEVDGVSVYNYMWGPSEFSCTGTLQGHDSTPLLKDIKVPVLYLAGEYDSGSPEAAKYYNSMTPNGEICVLPGCGHDASRERPEEFNVVVDAFASRVGDKP
jgi:proline iminopeptidase